MRRECVHLPSEVDDWDVEVLKDLDLDRLDDDDDLADLVAQAEVLHSDESQGSGFLQTLRGCDMEDCRVAFVVVHFWDSVLPPQLAGFVVYKHFGPAWFMSTSLLHLSVASRYRGLGFGRKLVALVEDEASQLSLSGEITVAASPGIAGLFWHLHFSKSLTHQADMVLVRRRFHVDLSGSKSPSFQTRTSWLRHMQLDDLAGARLERASSAA